MLSQISAKTWQLVNESRPKVDKITPQYFVFVFYGFDLKYKAVGYNGMTLKLSKVKKEVQKIELFYEVHLIWNENNYDIDQYT